jgi:hypothetical protein
MTTGILWHDANVTVTEPLMHCCAAPGVLAVGLLLLTAGPASGVPLATDANIVTGLDISCSIEPDDMKLELAGMAQAIRDPRVLRAIEAGKQRRIGFAVFAWHHGSFPSVVPWMTIGSAADAALAASAIEARTRVNVELEGREQVEWYIGRFTDLSEAIDHASDLLQAAPFASDRAIINIVGNGDDNVGAGAGPARDQVVARGGTINGLVLGDDPAMVAYYRDQVIGGRSAFVMSTRDADSIADAFARKFIADIIAAVEDVHR